MNLRHSFRQSCGRLTAILAAGTAMFLSSCDEKKAEATAEAQSTASTEVETTLEELPGLENDTAEVSNTELCEKQLTKARNALFDHALYVLGQKVTSPDAYPELNSAVKDMLELMQA